MKTDVSDKFAFRPSVHDLPTLTEWRGFSLRLTDPHDMAACCGPELGPGLSETHPDQAIHVSGYFPVALVEPTRAAKSNFPWSTTRRLMESSLGMRVPLLPMLSAPDDCGRVTSPQLARDCRQLMTEVSAILR